MDDPRRQHWEQATEWPLTAVALAFLAAYAWPILDPDLPADWVVACQVVGFSAWVLFALDYLARLWLSQERLRFVRQHLLDLAVVILPILRPSRCSRCSRCSTGTPGTHCGAESLCTWSAPPD
jgi:voltage-gated potassium channel